MSTIKTADVDVESVVQFIQGMMYPDVQETFTQNQARTTRRRAPKPSEYTDRYWMNPPEDDGILNMLLLAIRDFSDGSESFEVPAIAPIDVEWVSHQKVEIRRGAESNLDAKARKLGPVLLWIHGGGHYQGCLDERRPAALKLAQEAGGICLTMSMRLAPQVPFPAAILDVLLVYLSLMFPGPKNPHIPIPANQIVLCGDSGGVALCAAVVQTILQARRRNAKLDATKRFHGLDIPLHLPAGIAFVSPYWDLTHSMPSWANNNEKDILHLIDPPLVPGFPSCRLWPTDPPRTGPYADASAWCHPFVSPLTNPDWTDFPPMWFCSGGNEMAIDEAKFVAQQAARAGVPTVWEEVAELPHCFAILPPLTRLPHTARVYKKWAAFCRACVENPNSIQTKGTQTAADNVAEQTVDVSKLTEFALPDVRRRMEVARADAVARLDKVLKSSAKL